MRIVPIGISILEGAERKPVDVCFGVRIGLSAMSAQYPLCRKADMLGDL